MVNKVSVLVEGFTAGIDVDQTFKSRCTATLIQAETSNGLCNILVDSLGPQEKQLLIDGLKHHSLKPCDIGWVVCTHGHVDHIGNLNLFSGADIFLDTDIYHGESGSYSSQDFNTGHLELASGVSIFSTPGHTMHDVSVLVKDSNIGGNIVVAGDAFECKDDSETWKSFSANAQLQEESRQKILSIADWIIPGHGAMFQPPKNCLTV